MMEKESTPVLGTRTLHRLISAGKEGKAAEGSGDKAASCCLTLQGNSPAAPLPCFSHSHGKNMPQKETQRFERGQLALDKVRVLWGICTIAEDLA